jgi:hypothetical protein
VNWQNHSDPSVENDEKAGGSSLKEGSLKDYPLNPMQHAYLKGISIETALYDLVYNIDGSLAQKKFASSF